MTKTITDTERVRDANLVAELKAKAQWRRTEVNTEALMAAEKWFAEKHHGGWQDWAMVKPNGRER